MNLTKRQRQILRLIHEHGGAAIFLGGTRGFQHRVDPDYGLIIHAYQSPQYALAMKGLLQKTAFPHAPQYALTDAGRTVTAWVVKRPAP